MIKLGDAIQIKTDRGYSCIQYVFNYEKPPTYGKLFRVYSRISTSPLSKLPITHADDYFVFLFTDRKVIKKYEELRFGNFPEGIIDSYEKLPDFKTFQASLGAKFPPARFEIGRLDIDDKEYYEILPKKYYHLSYATITTPDNLFLDIENGYCPRKAAEENRHW